MEPNRALIAARLQKFGISSGGAWEVLNGQAVARREDRERLAAVLCWLLDSQSQASPSKPHSIRTQSGIVIDFSE